MEIRFNSKTESKAEQEKTFLALSPAERMIQFFALSSQLAFFPTKQKEVNSKNFILERKK